MEYKVIGKGKGVLEVELDDKTITGVLASELVENGVDAATYDPHPLFEGMRLKINSASPEKDLKAAVASAEKKVAALKKSVL